jgi:hypothetical protein
MALGRAGALGCYESRAPLMFVGTGEAGRSLPGGVTVGCGLFAQCLPQGIAGLVRDQVPDPFQLSVCGMWDQLR